MRYPRYYAVNDRPVKLVELLNGSVDCLVLDHATGAFVPDRAYLSRTLPGPSDVDALDSASFASLVAKSLSASAARLPGLIENALARANAPLAAWDLVASEPCVFVYDTGAKGATLLAYARVHSNERDAIAQTVRARAVPAGGVCGPNEHVWAWDDTRFRVFTASRLALDATRSEIVAGTHRVFVSSLRAIVSFHDPDDMARFGLRLVPATGPPVDAIEDREPTAHFDPTYDNLNLAFDSAWATSCGRDLARWLGVAHEDELP